MVRRAFSKPNINLPNKSEKLRQKLLDFNFKDFASKCVFHGKNSRHFTVISQQFLVSETVNCQGCSKHKYLLVFRLPGEPPLANPIIPVVGRALEFGLDPRGLFQKLQKKLGDVYTVTIAGWLDNLLLNFQSLFKYNI